MEVVIRCIYYCASGFRTIASTYFPSRFYCRGFGENSPLCVRGPQNQWIVCSTCRCTAIILIFPLFVLYGFFSSTLCHHDVPSERISRWMECSNIRMVRAFLREYNNSQKKEKKRKIFDSSKFHSFGTKKKFYCSFFFFFFFGISSAGSTIFFCSMF